MIYLSEAQKSIVNAPLNLNLQVLATAGSGKTRVLTERIRTLLGASKKDGVIALTFTNLAASEMRSRLEEFSDLDNRCWIGTIHSIAQRIVDQYGHAIGLPSELHIYEREEDKKALFIQSILEEGISVDEYLGTADEKDRSKKIRFFMDSFSTIKRSLMTEAEIFDKFHSQPKLILSLRKYQETLLRSGGMDFDDILVYAHKILVEQKWCGDIYRAKYKHICVDEAQDLNRAQYEFIKAFAGDSTKSILMVGDPNQMIFGFNGSSNKFLCEHFPVDFKAKHYTLDANYRSTAEIVALANKIYPGSQRLNATPLQGKRLYKACEDEKVEATYICDLIESTLNLRHDPEIEGEISLNKMVVIGRNKFVFSALENELSGRKIPFYRAKGDTGRAPTSMLCKTIDLAIRLKLNPKDWIDGQKLCTALDVSARENWNDADTLFQIATEVARRGDPLSILASQALIGVHSLDLEKPNIPKLIAQTEASLNQLASSGTDHLSSELERAFAELEEIRNCWLIFRKKGLGERLSSFRNAMSLGQLHEPPEPNGIAISTVHTMKGLEKDIVFLMGMCEGVFPDYRAKNDIEIEEERNNAFVALTRARRWIALTWPLKRKMPWGDTKLQRPSRFLREMELV
ncbi:DNA helicase-2/ATP-dependent DNA helicase PcrA [Pseudomonas sp. SORGH_AS199]|uniref:ATP-dependent helicase n=1 Tax=Pseudomonas sp. SORGH_AS_0199 TaxID=3041761 RepID=UPI00285CC737|nr:ATP-dependent helicase [Pseudomonas sp. SORGH_AS_0199]MDR6229865.1 DNA helicase-2/ATP-dependent DNA helicase PcrA [Pseudomonas sp. SORGH_AS_0199]